MSNHIAPVEDLTLEMARLIYLLAEHQIRVPKGLESFLPYGEDWLSKLHLGVSTAAEAAEAPLEQIRELYLLGAGIGKGSRDEGKRLFARFVDEEVKQKSLTIEQRSGAYRLLESFIRDDGIVSHEEFNLGEQNDVPPIQKFDSGFYPFDFVTEGFYQGIVILVARPGMGKTSLSLSMMEQLVKTRAASSCWFFQNEIPGKLMLSRLGIALKRTKFRPTDRLICGAVSVAEMIERTKEDPDPNRVIFFDSPDVVANSGNDERRFQLEDIYQQLVVLKQRCKMVVATSQPNRRNADNPTLSSLAEAWQKAWFADIVLALSQVNTMGESTRLRVKAVKNRFGPVGRHCLFKYRYHNLTWDFERAEEEGEDADW
jgi:hypothetical protein